MHVLKDIEIKLNNNWMTLMRHFTENPPKSIFGDYSKIWKNDPQGLFFIAEGGGFIHRRTDTKRVYKINWRRLDSNADISDVASLKPALQYYVVPSDECKTAFEQIRKTYAKQPFPISMLIVDSSGNGRVFIPHGDRLKELKVSSLRLVTFTAVQGNKQLEINTTTSFKNPILPSL